MVEDYSRALWGKNAARDRAAREESGWQRRLRALNRPGDGRRIGKRDQDGRGGGAGGAAAALLRLCDGGVRHHPAALQRDRRRQGGGDRPARDRRLAVRRGHPVLPDLLRDRRRADRGLRLCPRPALHLGGLFGALLFMAFMAFVVVALPPAPDWGGQAAYEAGVRPGAAHRLRLDRRLLGGRVRQFLRAGAG